MIRGTYIVKYVLKGTFALVLSLGHLQAQEDQKLDPPLGALLSSHTNTMRMLQNLSTPLSERKKSHNLYLNTNWSNSAIITKDGKVFYFNGRFSVLDEAIELLYEDHSRMISPARIAAAMVNGRYFESISKERFDDALGTTFLEVLTFGKIKLYARHYLKSKMQGSNSLTLGMNGQKVYYIDEELYYAVDEGPIEKIPSRKKLEKKLISSTSLTSTVLDDANINTKSKEDLIAVFEKLNELVQ